MIFSLFHVNAKGNQFVSSVVEQTASSRTNNTINTSISTEQKRSNSVGILNIGRKRAHSPSTRKTGVTRISVL